MKNNELISIIMPMYNAQKYLAEALMSLYNQTYKNFEVLIIDDGSVDSSVDIANCFCNEDSRFKLIKEAHAGYAPSKNVGLRHAKGAYITFLDSDDCAHPQWLELLYKSAKKNNADIAVCNFERFVNVKCRELKYRYTKDMNECYTDMKMSFLFHIESCSFLWNKLFKRELFDGYEFPNIFTHSDVASTYRLFDKANKVVRVFPKLVHYRQRPDNMSNTLSHSADYARLRSSICLERCEFIWKNYPQSRYTSMLMTRSVLEELNNANLLQYVPKECLERLEYFANADVTPIVLPTINY